MTALRSGRGELRLFGGWALSTRRTLPVWAALSAWSVETLAWRSAVAAAAVGGCAAICSWRA